MEVLFCFENFCLNGIKSTNLLLKNAFFCFDSFFLWGGGGDGFGVGVYDWRKFYDYYIHKQKKHMCTIVSKWIVSLCYRRDNFDFLGFSLCNICLF